jgi:hypothetical protein
MSGKLKKTLAIIAALGITAGGVTEFLNHLVGVLPANTKLHATLVAVVAVIGLLTSYYNVSIKNPNTPPAGSVVIPPEVK